MSRSNKGLPTEIRNQNPKITPEEWENSKLVEAIFGVIESRLEQEIKECENPSIIDKMFKTRIACRYAYRRALRDLLHLRP